MPVTCSDCGKPVQVVDGLGRVWVLCAPYCNACRPGSVLPPETYARLRSAGTLAQHQLSVEAQGTGASADRAVAALRGLASPGAVVEAADRVVSARAQAQPARAAASVRTTAAPVVALYCDRFVVTGAAGDAGGGPCRLQPGHQGACDPAPPRTLDLDDRRATATGGLDAGAQARFAGLEIDDGKRGGR